MGTRFRRLRDRGMKWVEGGIVVKGVRAWPRRVVRLNPRYENIYGRHQCMQRHPSHNLTSRVIFPDSDLSTSLVRELVLLSGGSVLTPRVLDLSLLGDPTDYRYIGDMVRVGVAR